MTQKRPRDSVRAEQSAPLYLRIRLREENTFFASHQATYAMSMPFTFENIICRKGKKSKGIEGTIGISPLTPFS